MARKINTRIRRDSPHKRWCGRCRGEIASGQRYYCVATRVSELTRCEACAHAEINDFYRYDADGFTHGTEIAKSPESFTYCHRLEPNKNISSNDEKITCPACRGKVKLKNTQHERDEEEYEEADVEDNYQRGMNKTFYDYL